jgi:DNA polymerase V
MTILASLVPEMEIYSVDEAFLHLHGIKDLHLSANHIARWVTKCTGIPVSVGVAQTKTLCKIANHFAKKYKAYANVCVIDTEEKRVKALQKTEIGDVWGIGRQHRNMLLYYGVKTAYDFTMKSRSWVRSKMTVIGERTWRELNGQACLEKEDSEMGKKQICTSRSFGIPVVGYDGLLESVVALASLGVSKLRKQKSLAKTIYVMVQTNRFEEDAYRSSRLIALPFLQTIWLKLPVIAERQ